MTRLQVRSLDPAAHGIYGSLRLSLAHEAQFHTRFWGGCAVWKA